jgi:hypothetical protein
VLFRAAASLPLRLGDHRGRHCDAVRVGDRGADIGRARNFQLDQDRGVAVEVRDREEAGKIQREDRVLRVEVLDDRRDDVAGGWKRVAEALDVGLAERALLHEAAVADHSGVVAPLRADGDAGKSKCELRNGLEREHDLEASQLAVPSPHGSAGGGEARFADGRLSDAGEILEIDPPRHLVIRWQNM